jgi:hypothetical protein
MRKVGTIRQNDSTEDGVSTMGTVAANKQREKILRSENRKACDAVKHVEDTAFGLLDKN